MCGVKPSVYKLANAAATMQYETMTPHCNGLILLVLSLPAAKHHRVCAFSDIWHALSAQDKTDRGVKVLITDPIKNHANRALFAFSDGLFTLRPCNLQFTSPFSVHTIRVQYTACSLFVSFAGRVRYRFPPRHDASGASIASSDSSCSIAIIHRMQSTEG